jgi:putative SOS response-associated peptidase YedK
MCGRYFLLTNINELQQQFSFEFNSERVELSPSYNVAPTQSALTVTLEDDRRVGQMMRWGLIPSWSKDASVGSRMINARAETVAERPGFRSAFKRRRCLVIADGFYEWQKIGSSKIPMRINLKSGEPFAMAGLWEVWKNPEGESIKSCTIITTSANSFMEPIHDRMPVILPHDRLSVWLNTGIEDSSVLSELLLPYSSDEMESCEISTLVNSPANNVPEVLEPVQRLI